MVDDDKREIEIFPPEEKFGGDGPFGRSGARIWVSKGGEIRFFKLGPLQGFMLGAGLLLFLGLSLFFLSGFLLIMAPLAALLSVGAWVANRLGLGPFKRLR
ncbi:MAG: hypothetical protein N2444_02045 [Methylocystis sp.]|nr:hypothetical protein [Methylocystis sp.]